MLYFGSPAFFVDASDGLMLEQGVVESALGPYTEIVRRRDRVVPASRVPRRRLRSARVQILRAQLLPHLREPDPAAGARPVRPGRGDRSPRPPGTIAQFIQHDVWHKIRTRSGFSEQEIGLGVYAIVGVAFTIFSVWVAIFFWEAIFGGLVYSGLWNGRPGSRLLLLLLALFVAATIRGLIALVRTSVKRFRVLGRRVKFRFETSWRVEAAEAIDALPAFDELEDGVLSEILRAGSDW